MIYIIKGNEPFFIKKKVEEISSKEEYNLDVFDGSSKYFSIDDFYESLTTDSFLFDKRCILFKDPGFLIEKTDDDTELLSSYMKNPAYEVELVFYTYENNFNERLKLYKEVASNAQIITLNSVKSSEFKTYVNSRVNDLNISRDAIDKLTLLSKNNVTFFENSLEILKLFPDRIDEKVVDFFFEDSYENEIFDLINAITNKKIGEAVKVSRKILNAPNSSVLSVIGLLSSQLRFLYYVDYLSNTGHGSNEIASLTNSRPYRITMAFNALKNLNSNKILKMLSDLSDLDIKSKNDNTLSDTDRFELFIVSTIKRDI